MRIADVVTAALILALGIAMSVASWQLGAGWGKAGPQAGFFPFWLGVLLAVTSAGLVGQALLSHTERGPFARPEQLVLVLKVAGPAVLMVIAVHFIGFYFAMMAYLAVYMKWIGGHKWPLVAAISLAAPMTAFMVFEIWFAVSLRKGPLEIWLGY